MLTSIPVRDQVWPEEMERDTRVPHSVYSQQTVVSDYNLEMSEKPVFDLLGDKHGYGNESETELPPVWAQEQKTETTKLFSLLGGGWWGADE